MYNIHVDSASSIRCPTQKWRAHITRSFRLRTNTQIIPANTSTQIRKTAHRFPHDDKYKLIVNSR